jgi:hypothetical protein
MNQLVMDIITGKHDADLGEIISTAIRRRKIVADEKATVTFHEIDVGEEVRLGNIRPKYMSGRVGIVVEKTRTKFVVQFSEGNGRYSHQKATVSASCITRVNQGAKNAVRT